LDPKQPAEKSTSVPHAVLIPYFFTNSQVLAVQDCEVKLAGAATSARIRRGTGGRIDQG
jgi:hypothetical protein